MVTIDSRFGFTERLKLYNMESSFQMLLKTVGILRTPEVAAFRARIFFEFSFTIRNYFAKSSIDRPNYS